MRLIIFFIWYLLVTGFEKKIQDDLCMLLQRKKDYNKKCHNIAWEKRFRKESLCLFRILKYCLLLAVITIMNAPKFSFHTFPPIILTPSDLSAEVIIPPPYSPLSHRLIYRLRSPLIMFELSCIIHSQLCCSIRFMSLHGRFSSV